MLRELLGVGRLGLAHRLRHDLERVVIAPGLVVREFAVLFLEHLDVFLRARRVHQVVPNAWPDAGEIPLTGAPSDDGIGAETRDRELQAVFGILPDETRDTVAG